MVGGTVVGVQHLSDRVRLVINGNSNDSNKEVVKEVYPTGLAKMVRVCDSVWWQSGTLFWNGGIKKQDTPLVLIRQNDGDGNPWPYEDAAKQAGVSDDR